MNLAFFTPLFLAGVSLLTFPWWFHRIRRPDRIPVPFSSLMFLPPIKKEVVQRRRVQHILLMLLRMLLLLLLIFAYARPYWISILSTAADQAPDQHVLLLDISASMGAQDGLDQIKQTAGSILGGLRSVDRAGVIRFNDRAESAALLYDPNDSDAGRLERARSAVQETELSDSGTRYLPALQWADEMLEAIPTSPGIEQGARFIHVISDFQRRGMPRETTSWKLPSGVELVLHPIQPEHFKNASLTDVNVRETKPGELRVTGKVKNWTLPANQPIPVKLFVNGEETAHNEIRVPMGNASPITFRMANPEGKRVEGWLEIGADDLVVDNKRYFAYVPPKKASLWLISDASSDDPAATAWFVARALTAGGDAPWQVESLDPDAALDRMNTPENRPDLVVVCGLKGFSAETGTALLDQVRQGEKVLLMLDAKAAPAVLNESFLKPLGWIGERTNPSSRFTLLSWIDFNHAVFHPFQGARYNDFSNIRFYNPVWLRPLAQGDVSPANGHVLARFENNADENDPPAMIAFEPDQGRLLVWAFDLSPQQTNLAKSVKFVPLLFETLHTLSPVDDSARSWRIGDRITPPASIRSDRRRWVIELPAIPPSWQGTLDELENALLEVRHAGWVRWRPSDQVNVWRVEAVNPDEEESNLAAVPPEEFQIKFCTTPQLKQDIVFPKDRTHFSDPTIIPHEFGHLFIVLLLAFLLIECGYSSFLH